MAVINHFRELKVYRLAREQALVIFKLSRMFPPEEKYALTDQIRRPIGAMLNRMIDRSSDFCKAGAKA